jgi:hypothetical protein
MLAACTAGGVGQASENESASVSEAQYRLKAEDVRQCVVERGFDVPPLYLQADGLLLTFAISADTDDLADAGLEALDRCRDELGFDSVEKSYFMSHVPTGADREAEFGELLACLEDVGVDTAGLSSETSEEQIVAAAVDLPNNSAEGLVCLDKHFTLFPGGLFPGID